MKVKSVYDYLCEKFPLDTALDFDNVGLLVGSHDFEVSGIVVTLDCEIDTVRFAVKNGCNLIITHHPVIFNGIKNVLAGSVVYELIKNGISVISMHTNMDFATGGVNDAFCKIMGFNDIEIITASDGVQLRKCKISPTAPQMLATKLKAVLGDVVRYTECSSLIESLLICTGSGGNYLNDTILNQCQALITADVKHNIFIDSINQGICVFDAGHFATEDVIVKPLSEMLMKKFYSLKLLPYHSSKIKSY
ncbi:MAG: Nif3-like dinuclear metal center hexameric protein [Ruminococcaceae bacterium]|nr:Nif3-like dinuclear metal center hexameric protein [Oscillospiraceae bacterium]